MNSKDRTIAARVHPDLRRDLEARVEQLAGQGVHYPDGRPVDLSYVIRVGLRAYLDGEVALANPVDRGLFAQTAAANGAPERQLDDGQEGSARRNDPDTAKLAALKVAARIGTQRRRALEAFEAAGSKGLTADEVVVKLAPAPHNGTARRVTDLLQGGLIEPRPLGEGDGVLYTNERRDVTGEPSILRKTRAGAWAQVYRITGDGLLALTNKRREEAGRAGDSPEVRSLTDEQ